jgi:hypothetical protein
MSCQSPPQARMQCILMVTEHAGKAHAG